MPFESLECRRLFAGEPGVVADLQVDANRDGNIDAADVLKENRWTPGRGAIILPNLDRDNTNTGAPDNWGGGSFNGRPVAPNNVIDNAADLLEHPKTAQQLARHCTITLTLDRYSHIYRGQLGGSA